MQIEGAFFNASDYEISNNKKIGEGACGKVFLAKNKKDHKIYAAKILNAKDGFDGRQQMLLLRESLILHNMHHPSILKFQGVNFQSIFDPTKIEPTIITEFLSHGSLRDNLNKEKSTSPDKKWNWTKKYITLLGVSDAMRYLHEHEIIHRDLKSQNILVDDNYYPRICDFGLSRFLPQNMEEFEMTNGIGTPLYMAPELLNTNEEMPYGPSVDVYAFGMIMYEIMSGKVPFIELGKVGMYRFSKQIMKGYRPPLESIPDKMKELISKCWSGNINERPSFREIYEKLSTDFSYFEGIKIDKKEIKAFINLLENERKKEETKEREIKRDAIIDEDFDDDDVDDPNGSEQIATLKDNNSVSFNLYEKCKIAEIIQSNEVKGEIKIPAIIKFGSMRFKVLRICDNAFSNSSIESLLFDPDSTVKIIGNSAFENSKIRKIFIPRSLTKLESSWCKGADQLEEIEIDPNNLYFSNKNGFLTYKNDTSNQILFASRQFKGNFIIPKETTRIGDFAFINRKGLCSIKSDSSNIRAFGSFSFSHCENLTSISIKQETSLTLGTFCFSDSKNLSSFEISCKNLEIQNKCFNNCSSLSSFKVIKSETIQFHSNSFNGCTNIQIFSINNSSEIQIEKELFECSKKLKLVSFNEVNKIRLDKQAFKNFKSLENFTIIKSSEVEIGKECFNGSSNLKTIKLISDSIIFGENLFSGCNSLADVTIQTKSEMTITSNTFKSSDLNNITLFSPVLKLFPNCFEGFSNLTSIDLNSEKIEIYYDCFKECSSLTSFTLKSDVIAMRNNTFNGCNSIKKLSLEAKSELKIPDEFMKGSTNLDNVNLSGNQIILGDSSFNDCSSLKVFTIKESGSISFGNQLFVNSQNLESINIKINKNSKIEFPKNFFCGATKLKEFNLTGGYVIISNDCFKSCTLLNYLFITKTSKIVINDNQFSNMKSLQNVVLESDSDVDLGIGCFSGSEKLEIASIVSKNVYFADNCFNKCSSFINLAISKASNIKFGSSVFNNCNKLMSIVLCASSDLIFLDKCFNGSKFETIKIKGQNVTINNECFINCTSLKQLEFENVKNLTLRSNVFNKCNNLEGITFSASSSLTFLNKCFSGSSFKTIEINGQKVIMNNECFYNCTSLNQIKIGNVSDLILCSCVFVYCNKLEKIDFDISNKLKIGEDCFKGSNIKSFDFQGEIIETDKNCFKSSSITSISMHSTCIDLGNNSFEGCSNLHFVRLFSSSKLKIGENCFYGDKNIESIELQGNEIIIGPFGFYNCTSIPSLVLQMSSQVTIGKNAFENCTSLNTTSVRSDESFEAGVCCFSGANNLNSVQITSKKVVINGSCFLNCSYMKSFAILGVQDALFGEKIFENCGIMTVDVLSKRFKAKNFCFFKATSLKTVKVSSEHIFFGSCCFDKCSSLEQIICPSAVQINCFQNSFNGSDYQKYVKCQTAVIKIIQNKDESNDDSCLIF